MNSLKQRALLGALIGDACGVPYEFKTPIELPPRAKIEMIPPAFGQDGQKLYRTHGQLPGTWSDDGALLLCLLEALQNNSTDTSIWMPDFANKLIRWKRDGYMAVGGKIFDIGGQTSMAIVELQLGADPMTRRDRDDWSNGNGSLMRALAPALVATSVEHAVSMSVHSRATHATSNCESTCGVYAALAYGMIDGTPFEQSLSNALQFADNELMLQSVKPMKGTGHVLDSFWSAMKAVRLGTDYKSVIQHAIAFGNDTDTTACIAGGIAGIMYPLDENWQDLLRGKELLTGILAHSE